ncbi:hypothetical protein A3D88_01870 [Candidatus Peribacteria bacterium RIFCSPHIGHO2_02_FULL_52_16]|nr:MAG: hypothetical protein A2706_05065 [Candidatus Peribacteria bacterium RIFCSPHIGHO2_01_FULL_51_35]OGJ61135.1 MAG: hypothetical protein A3D88_01870 [Candidatus Peribacteria bacterium RIFCSPHIGHO2_02_FULL_52_16]
MSHRFEFSPSPRASEKDFCRANVCTGKVFAKVTPFPSLDGMRQLIRLLVILQVCSPLSALGATAPDPSEKLLVSRAEFIRLVMDDTYADDVDLQNCFQNIAPDPRRPVSYTHLFKDVSKDVGYGLDLCQGMFVGIVNGDPDGLFRPGKAVNFVEAAKIISKAYGIAPRPSLQPQPRVPWYEPYRYILARWEAIPPSVKRLDQPLTRADVRFILKALATEKPEVGFRYEGGARPVAFSRVQKPVREGNTPMSIETYEAKKIPVTFLRATERPRRRRVEMTPVERRVAANTPLHGGNFRMRLLGTDALRYRHSRR